MNDAAAVILQNMKSRRATRAFTGEPVADDDLFTIVQAGRFAASGANLRPHRFLITRDAARIGLIRSFSPGMLAHPAAIVAILIDHEQMRRQFASIDTSMFPYFDVGTAAQNMLNMAHALAIGACPVTSFSKAGVATALALPDHLSVELLVMLGQIQPGERQVAATAAKPVTTRDLTSWEVYGRRQP